MFRHIVLFSLDDRAQKDAIVAGLEALVGVVPGMVSMTAGIDAGRDPGVAQPNYDLGVVADFVDDAAFRGYLDHPAHAKVRDEMIRPFTTSRAAVQLVLPDAGS